MSLTTEPPRFNHSLSNTSTASFLANHHQPTATAQASNTPSTAPAASPAHSSPTSSAGSSVHTSSSSDRLGSSSAFGSGSMLSQADTSAASSTTTASPDSTTVSHQQHQQINKHTSPSIGSKDEAPEPGLGGGPSASAGGGISKMRRASTTDSESSSTQQDVDMSASSSSIRSSSSKSAAATESVRPHRKAARMGSFEARPQPSSRSSSAANSAADRADSNQNANSEPDYARPSQSTPSSADNRGRVSGQVGASSGPPQQEPTKAFNSPHPNLSPSTKHVDIVSYPSADLLRLLASLLEQIAHANDALHQRTASASGSRPRSGQQTPGGAQGGEDPPNAFERGMFDAAPLNSPITPLARPHMSDILMRDQPDGAGSQDGEQQQEEEEEEEEEEMPVTPGVDLLREVGEGGGVDGFMPSLGGTHYPLPLARRRGSSFLKARDETAGSSMPSYNRSKSSISGSTPTGPSISAAGALPGSIPPGTTPPTSNNNFPQQGSSSSNSGQQQQQSAVPEPPLTSLLTASSVALSSPSATLCFHARNIPAISIEAYLLRILKYCPTTNEVFLSLLVYFDRMARVGLEAQRIGLVNSNAGTSSGHTRGRSEAGTGEGASAASRMFAIDSFNIHRLVIAGVTVASKFFSDVFYTNSRYAKVGGLPLNELNQLELQFLLLNDFRLQIPTDELQRYADQLILYWVGRNGSPGPAGRSASSHPTSPRQAQQQQQQHTGSGGSRTPVVQAQTQAVGGGAPLTADAVASAAAMHGSQYQQHPSIQNQPQFQQPRRPSPGQHVGSNYTPQGANRPRSVRSQPSSSGTSVTSTVTPGTPSTPRGGGSSSGWGDDSTTEDGSEADSAAGQGEPMEQD